MCCSVTIQLRQKNIDNNMQGFGVSNDLGEKCFASEDSKAYYIKIKQVCFISSTKVMWPLRWACANARTKNWTSWNICHHGTLSVRNGRVCVQLSENPNQANVLICSKPEVTPILLD